MFRNSNPSNLLYLFFSLILFISCTSKPNCYSEEIVDCELPIDLQGLKLPLDESTFLCICDKGLVYSIELSHANKDFDEIYPLYKKAIEDLGFQRADSNRTEELILFYEDLHIYSEIKEYFFKGDAMLRLHIDNDIVHDGLFEVDIRDYSDDLIPYFEDIENIDAKLLALEEIIDDLIDQSSNNKNVYYEDLKGYNIFSYSYGNSRPSSSLYDYQRKTIEKINAFERLSNSEVLAVSKQVGFMDPFVTEETTYDEVMQQEVDLFVSGEICETIYFIHNESKEILGTTSFCSGNSEFLSGKSMIEDLYDNHFENYKDVKEEFGIN